jgi:4-hydroxy-2-oxoheptanedioate aldolase
MTTHSAAPSAATPLNGGELRNRIRDAELTIGTFAGMGAPAAVEVCAAAGVDWVVVDLEHGAGSESELSASISAASSYSTPALVRVEAPERIRVGRALDLGAAGIMFPRIESADHARRAIEMMQYPPRGLRGAATYNRQGRFGLDREILDTVGDGLVGIIQIETASALAEIDAIAAIKGVDVLFVGPVDLSYALGIPFGFQNAAFRSALESIVRTAEANGVTAGIMAANATAAADFSDAGFRFISIGSDATVLAQALSSAVGATRDRSVGHPDPERLR